MEFGIDTLKFKICVHSLIAVPSCSLFHCTGPRVLSYKLETSIHYLRFQSCKVWKGNCIVPGNSKCSINTS